MFYTLAPTSTRTTDTATTFRTGSKRRGRLGAFGKLTVHEARRITKQLLGEIAKGEDPLAKREGEKRRQGQRFDVVVDDWLERDQKSNRSFNEVQRLVNFDILPAFKGRGVDTNGKRDIVKLLDTIADRGAPVMANRTLAHIRRLFRWAIERDVISDDPTAGIGKRPVEEGRDRVLDDGEIVAILNAAKTMGAPYGAGIHLLFLTGARREGIFGESWNELNEANQTLSLPAARSKIKHGRHIHLTGPAWSILEALPRFGPYIFATNGKVTFSGFSKAKKALDEARGVSNWRVHDIRRTVATGLQ